MPKEESQKMFFEIANWKNIQSMIYPEAPWFKVNTSSILDHETFINLDGDSCKLLMGLWALAARLGTHIFPVDTKWLMHRMAFLTSEPDLKPLFEAKDMYGRDDPFIRYCEPPVVQQKNNTSSDDTKKTYSQKRGQKKDQQRNKTDKTLDNQLYERAIEIGIKKSYVSANKLKKELEIGHPKALSIINLMRENGLLGKYVNCMGHEYITSSEKTKTEESRVEKSREEEKIPYRISGEKKEKLNPNGFNKRKNPKAEAQRQIQALMQAQAQDIAQKPVNPTNPIDPDESAVVRHDRPKQPTSSFRGGSPQSLGRIIKGDFKINGEKLHWNDPECKEFAGDVLTALGVTATNDELGAFARWLFRLKAVCKPDALIEEIKQKMVKKARWINSPKCKRKDNPSALLTFIIDKELETRGIKLPNPRASPA